MEQVFAATLALLEEHAFDDVSITDILARSGQSAGQFYGRFANKEAVFTELCRQFEARMQARILAEVAGWGSVDRLERARRLVRLVASLNIENRPVLRSMLLRVWRQADGIATVSTAVRNEGFEKVVLAQLVPPGVEETTVREVFDIISVACREKLLFGDLASSTMDDPAVKRFLSVLTSVVEAILGGPTRPEGT
jgi:AcrR family transcriptional regulator